MTNTASPKQIKFIRSLFDTLATTASTPEVGEAVEPIHNQLVLAIAASQNPDAEPEITKRDASRIIEVLLPLSNAAKAAQPAEDIRWKKWGDRWVIHGDPAVIVPGATVTVTSSRGTAEKVVDKIVSSSGANVLATVVDDRKLLAAQKAEAETEVQALVESFHEITGTGVCGLFLPAIDGVSVGGNEAAFWYLGRKSVSQVLGGTGRVPRSVADQKAVIEVVLSMSPEAVREAMMAYGVEMGTCGHCGKSLTTDLSRERGVGPECWQRGGF